MRGVVEIALGVRLRGRQLAADGSWVEYRENQIVITELPVLVPKGGDGGVIREIKTWVNSERGRPVAEIFDESDRSGMRIVITLRRSLDPSDALDALHTATSLEVSAPIQLIALSADGEPRQHTLLELIDAYIAHQRSVRAARVRPRGVDASFNADIDASIKADLAALAKRFGDDRRTRIGPA